MDFKNSSYYIIPMSVESCDRIKKELELDLWKILPKSERKCGYLFDYVSNVIADERTCSIYSYCAPETLDLNFHEKGLKLSSVPELEGLRLYVFTTGVAFLEYYVTYGDLPIDDIIRFAYRFKSVDRQTMKEDRRNIYAVSCSILPEERFGVKFYFANTSHLKTPTLCYHMLKHDYESKEERNRLIFHLKRSYNGAFEFSEDGDLGKYDMVYAPYDYIAFGGSQEGFVSLCRNTGKSSDYFLDHFFYDHLTQDYHYLYLILLNQRFSEIKYIEEIANTDDSIELVEHISEKIIHLKTRFSFHVVSDDYIYQNVYAKMYEIFDIDKLFLDIEENGERLAIVQSNDISEREKDANKFLMYISILAVFSALMDLASYIDRTSMPGIISTVASFLCVGAILTFGIFKTIIKRKKNKRNKNKR